MPSQTRRSIVSLSLIVVGVAVSIWASSNVESAKPKLPQSYADSDLAVQGKRLKGFALGTEGLIADWYWILSLQYIGGKIVEVDAAEINFDDLRNLNPKLLYPYLDNATDLDPQFFAAYSYGAIVLPAIDTEKAIALTEKGIRNNPDRWRLYQYLGYIYWRAGRFEKAAATYDAGSKVPGAPPFMRHMVPAMLNKGGSRDTARAMYTQMLQESDDQQSRQIAELRLISLDALDQLDAINSSLTAFQGSRGTCPAKLSEVAPSLRTVRLSSNNEFRFNAANELVDPTGVPYVLDRDSCKAHLDYSRSKIPAQ